MSDLDFHLVIDLRGEITVTKITIVDSIMGSGKTTWSLQYIKELDSNSKILFVTPFLSEVERIIDALPDCKLYDPQNRGSGKLESLKDLIAKGFNIISTHALFEKADMQLIKLLEENDYILIQDEVLDVVKPYELKKNDFELLMNNHMILVEPKTGIVSWNEESPYQETKYDEIKRLSKTENLIYFQETILFWTLPIGVFKAFKEVYVLTYLFSGSDQKYYLDMFNIEYKIKAVTRIDDGTYELTNIFSNDKKRICSLINVYDGKLNNIGEKDFNLSKSWFNDESNKDSVDKIKKNQITYFKNNVKTPSHLNMWTCFKDHESKLKGKGYSKGFIPLNSRATNDFQDKASCSYVINRFMHPYKKNFFLSRGVDVDQDLWALSELIQWIWRSRIRKGEHINLYIPSKRMRSLLKRYLDSNL
jgi:hypothetical protein